MTSEQLATLERIKGLLDRATPGPWTVQVDSCRFCSDRGREGEYNIPELPTGYHALLDLREDADLITELRNAAPWMIPALEQVERLQDLVRHQRHALLDTDLITREEFAALMQVPGSVARLGTYDQMRAEIASIRERIAELEKDKARLDKAESMRDWINSIEGPGCSTSDVWIISDDDTVIATGKTLRAALDAAKEKS